MRVLIVGFGSIGRRHLRQLKKIDPSGEAALLRSFSRDTDLGEWAPLVREVFTDETQALVWRPEAVVVANPAPWHIPTALAFARQGSHLFIEKPLAVDLAGIDDLIGLCRERRLVAMVAYVLRFLEPMMTLRQAMTSGRIGRILSLRATVGRYLPDWRPGTDYRRNVSARRELGGGVLAELSHELDYVRWLAGEVKTVRAVLSRSGELDIDVEDAADLLLTFDGGAVGQVHMDMLDRAVNRSCRIIGTEGTLTWDLADGHRVCWYGPSGETEDLFHDPALDYDRMFMAELRHFLDCVRTGQPPAVGLEEGRRIVELMTAARCASEEGRTVTV